MIGMDGQDYPWWRFPVREDPADDPYFGTPAEGHHLVGSYQLRLGR